MSLNNGDLIGFYNPFLPAHPLIKLCTKGGVGHIGIVLNVRKNEGILQADFVNIRSNLMCFDIGQPELKIRPIVIDIKTGVFTLKKSRFSRVYYFKNNDPFSDERNEQVFLRLKSEQKRYKYSIIQAICSTANEHNKLYKRLCDWSWNYWEKRGFYSYFCSNFCADFIYGKISDKYIDTKEIEQLPILLPKREIV